VKILALDAATEVCSVAVWDGENVFERRSDIPKSHAQQLLPLVDEVLSAAATDLASIDAIAVTHGPGSFTGIRIGIGIAQGLSYGAKIPAIGVNTLEVMAQGYVNRHPSYNGYLVPALDARMAEVYWGVYRVENGILFEYKAAQVCAPENVTEYCEANLPSCYTALGHGWKVIATPAASVQVDPEWMPRASAIVQVAERQTIAQIETSAIAEPPLEPLYLRNEISWKKRQRIRPPNSL
jgi:universal bacterial protein YeaZ